MYAIIDIETTGLSSEREKITEIAIFIHDGKKIVDEFISLVNPEKRIPYNISRMTGITNELVENAPKFYEIAKEIIELTENKIIVAHNANFDYSFIKSEYKSLGFDFKRETICTVKLSRKLIPGKRSYSLGKLCEEIGININGRHRAAGDALATLTLFELLLSKDSSNGAQFIKLNKDFFADLHPNLSKEYLNKLPEETGVYYLFDINHKLIYIGKSKNIHDRIVSHLGKQKFKRAAEMRLKITDISYELTGSELIALLLESEEIKKHKPFYNRSQIRSAVNYGVFSFFNEDGYLCLKLDKNSSENTPLTSFPSRIEARDHLFKLVSDYNLCQKLSGLYDSQAECFHYSIRQCNGACTGIENPADYNQRASKAIQTFEYEHNNFLIIDKGRNPEEKSVIRIENGKYIGFGYIELELIDNNLETLKDCVQSYKDNRDVQQIIKRYLRKNKVEKIISF